MKTDLPTYPEQPCYVYIRSEPGLWTVGFYKPDGTWEPESDHHNSADAAAPARAHSRPRKAARSSADYSGDEHLQCPSGALRGLITHQPGETNGPAHTTETNGS